MLQPRLLFWCFLVQDGDTMHPVPHSDMHDGTVVYLFPRAERTSSDLSQVAEFNEL
jgi:hypothetical protein